MDDAHKARHAVSQRKYVQTASGQETRRRYEQSAKGRARKARYRGTAKGMLGAVRNEAGRRKGVT